MRTNRFTGVNVSKKPNEVHLCIKYDVFAFSVRTLKPSCLSCDVTSFIQSTRTQGYGPQSLCRSRRIVSIVRRCNVLILHIKGKVAPGKWKNARAPFHPSYQINKRLEEVVIDKRRRIPSGHLSSLYSPRGSSSNKVHFKQQMCTKYSELI